MDTTLLDLMLFDFFLAIEAFIEEIHPALKDEYYEDIDSERDKDNGSDNNSSSDNDSGSDNNSGSGNNGSDSDVKSIDISDINSDSDYE